MRFEALSNDSAKLSKPQNNDLLRMRKTMRKAGFCVDTSDIILAVATGSFISQTKAEHERKAMQSWAARVSKKLEMQPPFDD